MLLEISVVCGLLVLFYSVYKYVVFFFTSVSHCMWQDINMCSILCCRFAYAPYQVLKNCGIKGPKPVPFFGNYREETKMVILNY